MPTQMPGSAAAAGGGPPPTRGPLERRPIRVLVVDDSVVVRRLVSEALAVDPAIDVVGVAANGKIAMAKTADLKPDVVVLDVDMPVMNGIVAARTLRYEYPDVSIIMFATDTEDTQATTVDAMEAGADDYVAKPANSASVVASQHMVLTELVPKIKALAPKHNIRPLRARATLTSAPPRPNGPPRISPELAEVFAASGVTLTPPQPPTPPIQSKKARTSPYGVLVIGSSTGGPDALSKVIPSLPPDLPVPVMIVQHMPAMFTLQLARRLDSISSLSVREAADGEAVTAGSVFIAPGGLHMELARRRGGLIVALHNGPQENFCRPAVDVLFRSAAGACGDGVLAAVLTGMGRDGEAGARVIQALGGTVIAQDQATSVVWGMPGAVAQAGLADAVVALPDIAGALIGHVFSVRRRSR